MALVWGSDPPRTAEKTLQNYVGSLRRALGSEAVERVGDAYRLVIEPNQVDLVRFEQLLDAGDDEAALQLWQGAPLAGLKATGFDAVIGRLVERYVAAVEDVLARRIAAGRGVDEIGRLQELTSSYPLREGMWALLMRALYQAGRQAEALRAFDETRRHLVEGLGIEPGQALADLQRQILDHDPVLDVVHDGNGESRSLGQLEGHDLRAFLFTDIADSTALWERHAEEMRSTVERHERVLGEATAAQGGEIFKRTGDGVLAVFASSSAATNAAVTAQLELDIMAVGTEPLRVRMAISCGRAEARDDDWFGPPLNIAARLLDAAHGSQILLGGTAHERLDNSLDQAVTATDLGLLRLRGLSRPEHVHQILHAALPRRFPTLRTKVADRTDEELDFPPQLAYEGSTPFVGRANLLEAIGDRWRRVRSAEGPGLVLLAGEPGAGKTRLAAAVARSIREKTGATVLYGRCTEGLVVPFRPFTEALSTYARARSDAELRTEMGADAIYLSPVLQQLADRFPDLGDPLETTEATRLRVQAAITNFLQAASSSPLVLVLDDIHWSDQASLDLLRHLAEHLLTGRLLIIATYRDVEVDRSHPLAGLLADLRRERRVERHLVGGISGDDAVAFTKAIFGHELSERAREVATRLAADSNGNPFFLQEMLRHFMDSGVLVRRDGRWTADSAESLATSVPEGIREVVGRRLDHVGEECNALLHTASALTGDFDIDLLIDIDELDEDRALDLLDEALEAGLLVEGERAGRYEFSQALIRQTLYREFNTARRLRLHRRIAETLEANGTNGGGRSETIAHHYLAASTAAEPTKIAEWGLIAADEMSGRLSFGEASDLLEQIREEVSDDLSSDQQIRVEGALVAALMTQLKFEPAADAIRRCLVLAPYASPNVLGEAALLVAQAEPTRSMAGPSHALVVELLEAADPGGLEEEMAARLHVQRVRNGLDPVDTERLTRQMESMDALSQVAAFDTILYSDILNRDQAERLLDRIRSLNDATRHPAARGKTADLLYVLEQMVWNIDEAQQVLTSIPVTVQALDLGARCAMRLMSNRMFDALVRGDLPLLAMIIETMTSWAEGTPLEVAMLFFPRAFQYELQADDLGPPSDRLAGLNMPGGYGNAIDLLPPIRCREPDNGELLALASGPTIVSGFAGHLAQLIWEFDAVSAAEVLKPRFEPAGGLALANLATSMTTIFAVDYHLGLLAEILGDVDEAIELHHRALDQHRSAGYILDVGYSAWQLHRLLIKRNVPGDAEAAQTIIDDAVQLLEPTPFTRVKRLIDDELASTGARRS